MLRFLNVPPKSGEDVEFAPSGIDRINLIDTDNPSKIEDRAKQMKTLGIDTARMIIENMEEPTAIAVTGICLELAEKTPRLGEAGRWFEEFALGALQESIEQDKQYSRMFLQS